MFSRFSFLSALRRGFVLGLNLAVPLIAEVARSQEPTPDPDCRYVVLEGAIGKGLELRMFLNIEDEKVDGFYYYLNSRQPIRLRGEWRGARRAVVREESWQHTGDRELPNGGVTGTFEGDFSLPDLLRPAGRIDSARGVDSDKALGARFSGTWVSGDQNRRLPFELTEQYAPGILPADIYRFKVRWERNRGRESVIRQQTVILPQFRGHEPGIALVNAWIRAGISWPVGLDDDHAGEPESEESIFFSLSDALSELRAEKAPSLAEIEDKLSIDPVSPELLDTILAHSTRNEICANEGGMVSIRFYHSVFQGGAEVYGDDAFLTLDVKTGRVIRFDQLFKPGFEEHLKKMANRRLAENWGLKPGASLKEAGANVDRIGMSDDWFLTPDGIGFYFTEYAIAPGTFGSVRFSLPREDIAEWIAEGSVLARAVSR